MWRINQILPTTSQKSAFSWYITYIFLTFLGERWSTVTFMGGHSRVWSNLRAGGWNFGVTREWTSAPKSRLKSVNTPALGGWSLIWIRNAPPPPPSGRRGQWHPRGEQHLSGLKCRNLIVKEKNEQEHTDAACEGNLGKRSAWRLKGKRGHGCK